MLGDAKSGRRKQGGLWKNKGVRGTMRVHGGVIENEGAGKENFFFWYKGQTRSQLILIRSSFLIEF